MYAANLPFQFPPTHRLKLDEPVTVTAGPFELAVRGRDGRYVLTASDFDTEEEAAAAVARLWFAAGWAMLERNVGFDATDEVRRVAYADESRKIPGEPDVDGIADGNFGYVSRTGTKVVAFRASGAATLHQSAEPYLQSIGEHLLHPVDADRDGQQRLRTALELYASTYFQHLPETRLLTFVSALEALVVPQERHPAALALVLQFRELVGRAKDSVDTEAREALEQLENSISSKESKRTAVRRLVKAACEREGVEDAESLQRQVGSVYWVRNSLSHGSHRLAAKELNAAAADAQKLTRLVLRSEFRRLASPSR